jgi:hypothetical protein
MKQYTKLTIPADSAWDRFKWGRYVHWRIRYFFQGVRNIVRWIPTIYHDRDWDDYYITKMLQKKIEFQRAHLVYCNRHTNINRDNFWMTVVLNLLERKHECYYEMEYHDYVKMGPNIPREIRYEGVNEYIAKYPGVKRRALAKYKKYKYIQESDALSMFMASDRQSKCNALIFEILKQHSAEWWD